MSDIGGFALRFAFVTALYAVVMALLGVRLGRQEMVRSAERAIYGVFGLVTIAMVAMLYALLAHDFRLQYVASVSNRAMPTFYLIAALWGGQEGSMLLWLWILGMYSTLVVWQNRARHRVLLPYVISTLMLTALLFLAMLVFAEAPFAQLPQTPQDGRGLNPLLQHPLMVIHPPHLYLGFVGYAVPFAFAMGALASGQLDSQWIRSVRRWTLVPWLFNAVGILLGGQWAYVELGWGGYWAWDPVENASLMPWLTATAFLHSITLYPEKRLYFVQNQPTTEVALRTTLMADLYVILAGFEPSRLATFRVFINPLVAWMWMGGFVMVLGTVIAIWPERRPHRAAPRHPAGSAVTTSVEETHL